MPDKPTAKAPEEVLVTVKLPKALHAKMTKIAAAEGKPLSAKVAQAVRELAASYEQVSRTVTTYKRKAMP